MTYADDSEKELVEDQSLVDDSVSAQQLAKATARKIKTTVFGS